MGERELHVLLDRDRPALGDHRPDFIEELRHGETPRRQLHASTPMPAMMSGSERTIPIVNPHLKISELRIGLAKEFAENARRAVDDRKHAGEDARTA